MVSLIPRPIYSSTHWIRGWEGPNAGLNILEALAGIEPSVGSRAGSLATIPTDLPRLKPEDAHSGHAGSHPGPHLGYCCIGFWFNYFIALGKCLKLKRQDPYTLFAVQYSRITLYHSTLRFLIL